MNACSMFMPPDQRFDGGVLLDSEKLSEIKNSVFSSEIHEEDTEETTDVVVEKTTERAIESTEVTEVTEKTESLADTADTVTEATESSKNSEENTEKSESCDATEENCDDGDIVYWIASGEVWHLSQNCRYIKNKSFVSGTVEEAMEADKSRVCSACGK